MTTKLELENALKDAMRAGDDVRKSTLRMVLSAIRLTEIEKGKPLDEAGLVAAMHKEVKSRRESIHDAQRANRPDLIQAAEAEIAVLEGFLPKGLSAEELDTLVRQAIAEAGATSPRDMGQVMKLLLPRLQGLVPGDQASQAVRKLLGG